MKNKKTITAISPRDWMTKPAFGVTPRVGEIVGRDHIWKIGNNPHTNNTDDSIGLDIDHIVVLLSILSFVPHQQKTQRRLTVANATEVIKTAKTEKVDLMPMSLSYNQLSEAAYGETGSHFNNKIDKTLNDLDKAWMSIKAKGDPDGDEYFFHLISYDMLKVKSKGPAERERRIENLTVHKGFMLLLRGMVDTMSMDVAGFHELKHKNAKAIYMYLPSRAVKSCYNASNPYEENCKTIMEAILYRGKRIETKSGRYQFFTRGKVSLLERLDGARLVGGKIFRCRIEETIDGKDFKICSWAEIPATSSPKKLTKHKKFYSLRCGYSDAEYAHLLKVADSLVLPDEIVEAVDDWAFTDGGFQMRCFYVAFGSCPHIFLDVIATCHGLNHPGQVIIAIQNLLVKKIQNKAPAPEPTEDLFGDTIDEPEHYEPKKLADFRAWAELNPERYNELSDSMLVSGFKPLEKNLYSQWLIEISTGEIVI